AIARLLSMLLERFPAAQRMIAGLQAHPQPITVGLKPDQALMTVQGKYRPKTDEILISQQLGEPDASHTALHEMSHAHDSKFGQPLLPLYRPGFLGLGVENERGVGIQNPDWLMRWQRSMFPQDATIDPDEALAQFRATTMMGGYAPSIEDLFQNREKAG